MKPVLYCWNFTPDRAAALAEICSELGVRLRKVSPAETGLPVASLPEREPGPGLAMMPFREEMLLMARFPDSLVDSLLASLRRRGLTVARKAVLTPFNAAWDSRKLFAELSAEAALHG